MREFPETLNVRNKENFSRIRYERLKCYLRRDLYEHILSGRENVYFCLDKLKEELKDENERGRMINEVIEELKMLGWNCQLVYGSSGLFVYSDKRPENCFESDTLS